MQEAGAAGGGCLFLSPLAPRAAQERSRSGSFSALWLKDCNSSWIGLTCGSDKGSLPMPHINVGFVIFPDLTQLDFTGPQQVLARLPDSAMHIVAKTLDPVPSDSGLSLMPTHTFEDCPSLDLICVPGGYRGVIDAMVDHDLITFVQRQAQTAKY